MSSPRDAGWQGDFGTFSFFFTSPARSMFVCLRLCNGVFAGLMAFIIPD